MIIAIDAGHGMKTAGKRCMKKLDPKETREWYLNDRIADKVESTLTKNYDCKVLRVDDTTGKKDISLSNRVKTANNANADAYVSIHHNAGIGGKAGGGTVVFYYSSKPERLAQANSFYKAVVDKTKLVGNRAQKVVKKGFYVLANTKMPAFLIENGFMDSSTDVPIILTDEHAEKTAQGIIDFIVSEYKLTKKKATQKVSSANKATSGKYYPKCNKKYATIYSALTSIGVNGGFSNRKKIAKANKINGYVGTATQNTRMLNLLKAGLLIKP